MSQGNTQADAWRGESHLSPGDTLRPDDTHSHTPEQWYTLDNTVLTRYERERRAPRERAPPERHGTRPTAAPSARRRCAPRSRLCTSQPQHAEADTHRLLYMETGHIPPECAHSVDATRRTVGRTWHSTQLPQRQSSLIRPDPCTVRRRSESRLDDDARGALGTCAPGRLAALVTTTAAQTQPPGTSHAAS